MPTIIQNLVNWIDSADPEKIKAWGPIGIGIITLFITFIIQYMLIRHQRKQFERQIESTQKQFERQNELSRQQLQLLNSKEEREEIHKKLNAFYGPFKELRTQSKLLYRKFAASHREVAKKAGTRFRTLQYLLEGKKFTGQDEQIFCQILQINKGLLSLIESQSGVVDKPALQELLGKLGAHIRILQLAYEGKLSGSPEDFADIVFPLPVDSAVESAILRLQDNLKQLEIVDDVSDNIKQERPAANSTIQFYDDNSDLYAGETLLTDLNHLYVPFLEQLPTWGRILDAGCGVGRDTRYFIEQGSIVISFDASREMVKKCREYPHSYCIKRSFSEIDFKEEFDGVWACASLLHLSKTEVLSAVSRLTTAIKPGGVIFVSLKEGIDSNNENGRFFQYYKENELQHLYAHDVRLEHIKQWKSSSPGNGVSEQIQWFNLILRRRQQCLESGS